MLSRLKLVQETVELGSGEELHCEYCGWPFDPGEKALWTEGAEHVFCGKGCAAMTCNVYASQIDVVSLAAAGRP